MKYSEDTSADYNGFVICFWEMQPLTDKRLMVNNIIAADGCIDIVVEFDERVIACVGMRKTVFDFSLNLPSRSFGMRMMPGAFHQLTGLPAAAAMDTLLPITEVFSDFDGERFFSMPYEHAREHFKAFLTGKINGIAPNTFVNLFHVLYENTPSTTKELYKTLNFSPRQCQRLFMKHYGINPKMVLSIIRFQKCLEILMSGNASPADILNATNYYDQPHFINDFKRNMGLTPLELIRIYRS